MQLQNALKTHDIQHDGHQHTCADLNAVAYSLLAGANATQRW
jgi:hypothetical protein